MEVSVLDQNLFLYLRYVFNQDSPCFKPDRKVQFTQQNYQSISVKS